MPADLVVLGTHGRCGRPEREKQRNDDGPHALADPECTIAGALA